MKAEGEMSETEQSQTEELKETPQSPPSVNNENYVTVGTLYLAVILVSIVVSVISVLAYDRYFAMRVASFDLPGHMLAVKNDLSTKVTSGQMTVEQAQQAFGQDLEQVANTVNGAPGNVIIISGDALLGHPRRLIHLQDKIQNGNNVQTGSSNIQNGSSNAQTGSGNIQNGGSNVQMPNTAH